jgi:hypothetical protein
LPALISAINAVSVIAWAATTPPAVRPDEFDCFPSVRFAHGTSDKSCSPIEAGRLR